MSTDIKPAAFVTHATAVWVLKLQYVKRGMDMSSGQKQTEEFLKMLAGAVDEIVEEQFGERIAFSILLWPKNEPELANYISNANRVEMIESLRSTLLRWENDLDNKVGEKINPKFN